MIAFDHNLQGHQIIDIWKYLYTLNGNELYYEYNNNKISYKRYKGILSREVLSEPVGNNATKIVCLASFILYSKRISKLYNKKFWGYLKYLL